MPQQQQSMNSDLLSKLNDCSKEMQDLERAMWKLLKHTGELLFQITQLKGRYILEAEAKQSESHQYHKQQNRRQPAQTMQREHSQDTDTARDNTASQNHS